MDRRTLIKWSGASALGLLAGCSGTEDSASDGDSRAATTSQTTTTTPKTTQQGPYAEGTYLVDETGDRVREDALQYGSRMTVYPESQQGTNDAAALLVRYEEDRYAEPTKLAFTAGGYAAYSKVCTHAGCQVSEARDDVVLCPCHSSAFDPTRGAEVVDGPASRALPQLPITVSSDGVLLATGAFEDTVGV